MVNSNMFMLLWLFCILFGEDLTPVTEYINFLSKNTQLLPIMITGEAVALIF